MTSRPVNSGYPEFGILTRQEESVLRLIRRKPALADAFTQLGELVLQRRNCRFQLEVVDGILRRYDVTPASKMTLEPHADSTTGTVSLPSD